MKPSHPGKLIKEEIFDELNLSISQAAEMLAVDFNDLLLLTEGKAAMTPNMASKIREVFNVPSVTLLNMQKLYDNYLAQQQQK
jgi:addiction module HigA family antidote